MRLFILLALAVLGCSACTLPISQSSLDLVDRELTFAALRQDPDRYLDRYLLLGGAIVAVRNTSAGSELEVVQLATDRSGRITSTDNSGGRFLVQVATFSDPAIYQGRLVTVVGKVTGQVRARLDEIDYLYPLLTAHEFHLWRPEEHPDASRVHFGFGFGVGTVIR
jgi:outer membrane lipoprotein